MDAIRLLGSLLGNNATGGGVGGALLDSIMKGGTQSAGGGGGGLGGLLGGAGGGGGLGGLLSGVLGNTQQDASGQGGGGLLGGLVQSALGRHAQSPSAQSGGLSGALGGLLGGGQEDPLKELPQQQVDDSATVLIRAMCNAAKADGQIDQQEQQNIVGRLGSDVGQEEIDFLRNELSQPLDVAGFVRQVPQGMQQQVYAMSVMAINVDTQAEAQYLGQLAQGLGLNGDACNQIHTQLGAPQIFS